VRFWGVGMQVLGIHGLSQGNESQPRESRGNPEHEVTVNHKRRVVTGWKGGNSQLIHFKVDGHMLSFLLPYEERVRMVQGG